MRKGIELNRKRDHKGRFSHGVVKGYYISKSGYKHIYRGNGKYSLDHRLKIEKKLGRKLKKGEVVHHVNHDRLDNRLKNLKLTTNSIHSLIHNIGSKASEKTKLKLREIRKGTNQKEIHPQWKKDVTKELIEEKLSQGKLLKSIAKELDIHKDTLRYRMKYYKLKKGKNNE